MVSRQLSAIKHGNFKGRDNDGEALGDLLWHLALADLLAHVPRAVVQHRAHGGDESGGEEEEEAEGEAEGAKTTTCMHTFGDGQ